mmetsp:Transcript_69167/g.165856  ORF Transcript_69167/g.165856 Transcript_69167/m.165856 type:complete len:114 (-) Transcript_69167:17-358(-)
MHMWMIHRVNPPRLWFSEAAIQFDMVYVLVQRLRLNSGACFACASVVASAKMKVSFARIAGESFLKLGMSLSRWLRLTMIRSTSMTCSRDVPYEAIVLNSRVVRCGILYLVER